MNKMKWHRAEKLNEYRADGNIVFLDRQGWQTDGMPVFRCNGEMVDNNDIFLWCTRKELLKLTDFNEILRSILFK